jgi:nicotinate-nucleotide pyrophosphorylase (carboxylating)
VTEDGRIMRVLETALAEDIGLGDLTTDSIIPDSQRGNADLLCKGDGILAGIAVAGHVFMICDPSLRFELHAADGDVVERGQSLGSIEGSTASILRAERTALNILQRMCGIATLTRRFCDAVAGTHARITDTRKTVPGLRVLDKLAVRMGGGVNHRFGLDDMVLIKDNHIAAAGTITGAVERVRAYLNEKHITVPIEVETKNLDEVREALRCSGLQRIMLDNFPIDVMKEAVGIIGRRVEVEASGGITLATVRAVAETDVDFISVGALTHSVVALDISLEL